MAQKSAAVVADITPRPLRTKSDSIEKIVGYAGTGVMLVAITLMVLAGERPDYLPLFLLQAAFMGVALDGFDLCIYPMLLELCDSNSVGRYSGYHYTVSMAAQVVTPILSGVVMDVAPQMLFGYITLMGVFMVGSLAFARHGDSVLIGDLEVRDEEREPLASA